MLWPAGLKNSLRCFHFRPCILGTFYQQRFKRHMLRRGCGTDFRGYVRVKEVLSFSQYGYSNIGLKKKKLIKKEIQIGKCTDSRAIRERDDTRDKEADYKLNFQPT